MIKADIRSVISRNAIIIIIIARADVVIIIVKFATATTTIGRFGIGEPIIDVEKSWETVNQRRLRDLCTDRCGCRVISEKPFRQCGSFGRSASATFSVTVIV